MTDTLRGPLPAYGVGVSDPFHLERFVQAQDERSRYADALAELDRGRKVGHWIWFVFPQVSGLGSSPMSVAYAVSGLAEARAYLAHPVLGPRLRQCCRALLTAPSDDPVAVLGPVDALKVRSSMTLFAHGAGPADEALFRAVLDRFYGGREDAATLELI